MVEVALLTVREVSQRLRISLASCYELIKKGKLIAVRIGVNSGAIRIREIDLAAYLAACSQRIAQEVADIRDTVLVPALKHIRLRK